jgi:plasmid stabilization system protein ParE
VAKVRWSAQAADDIAAIAEGMRDALGLEAADRLIERIERAAETLALFPLMGRRLESGERRWPVRRTPYVLLYEPLEGAIYVLRVLDALRKWPPAPGDIER